MTPLLPLGAFAGAAALMVGFVAVPATAGMTAPTAKPPAGRFVSTAATTAMTATTATAATAATAVPKACSVGSGVSAKQVLVVRSTGSTATIKACRRTSAGRYVVALGPFAGHVGRGGVAPKGAKREGDGRTPSGVFKLRGGFGVNKNPGVGFSWFTTDSRDRWVDDSSSRYYNLHKRAPAHGRWSSAERLKVSPAYDYAQVIGYNTKRTPGRGSAIFLHVDTGRGTAGCISLSRTNLLKLLRWEKPGAVISIKSRATTTTSGLRALSAPTSVRVASTIARPPYFSSSREATKADVPRSWRKGCPVGPSSLRVLRIRYWGFDSRAHLGTLVVNKSVAKDARAAFGALYAKKFAIRRMAPVDAYGGSDKASMKADNTSAFNCRAAVTNGPKVWSNHAYGVAIDINPRENPYVLDGTVMPKAGKAYLDRRKSRKGLMRARSATVKAFTSRGFRWGGTWSDPDYQHLDRR